MRLLTRYIVLELCKVFVVTLIVLTTIMMLAVVFKEALQQGLGLEPILRLIPYLLPNALRFAVPGTMLFAVCSVYGRIAADNEVVALKASGVSSLHMLAPALVLGVLVSPAAVWLNDVAVSWGRRGMHKVVLQSVEQIAYGMLRTKGLYATDKFSINVQRVEDRRLIQPIMSFHSSDGPATFTADEASMQLDASKTALQVRLINCEVDKGEDYHAMLDDFTLDIPLTAASRKGSLADRPSEMPLGRIPRERRLQRTSVEELQSELAALAAYQLLLGHWDEQHTSQLQATRHRHQQALSRMHRLETEPWRRWAVGFSCFFFVLVGAPLAIRMKNGDFWTSFMLCFLPILFVYYPLLALGVDRAKSGALPAYCVWTGNAVFGLVGFLMLRRVDRAASFTVPPLLAWSRNVLLAPLGVFSRHRRERS